MDSASPVGDVDTVDIVGVRKSGGVDLVISATAALDGSPATLSLLETKVTNYMRAALSEDFLKHYGCSEGAPVTIHISCAHPVAEAAHELIRKLREMAAEYGIGLELRSDMWVH